LNDKLQPLREGIGDLQSLSDEFLVFRDRRVTRVETLDGEPLGSFSQASGAKGTYVSAGPLGKDKLYLDDCKNVRIVAFDGSTLLKLHRRKGCSIGETSSATDGKRILLDYTERNVSGLRRVVEGIQNLATLGMVEPEDFNTERVTLFDTDTGKSCFEWQCDFRMTYSQIRSAAISPSGKFVAIVSNGKLSMYSLPPDCADAPAIPRSK
jgi:hypothetical protein